MRKTSEERLKQAVQMYRDGGTVPVVAKETGVSESVLYRALKARGIVPSQLMRRGERGAANRKLPLDIGKRLVEEYRSGLSLSALGVRYGVNLATIRAALEREGESRRRRGNAFRSVSVEQIDEMARLWSQGLSQSGIGKRFDLAQSIVSRVLNDAGHRSERRSARGSQHGNWNGGKHRTSGGYIAVQVLPDSPFSAMRNSGGYVMEHRLVMAQALGRPLTARETVHHINGDTQDNRIENLQLRSGNHGIGKAMRCRACGSHDIEAIALKEA